MKEIICISVGQAGVQLSNAAWELFCIEHGVEANGLLKENLKDQETESFRTFFQEVPTGQFVPRTVCIDLEPTVIDEIRTGPYRALFHPDQLISSMEDGANNYARGFFTIGKRQIDNLTNTTRKLVDACDMLQGFFIIHSSTGGTGSGFTTLTLDTLTLEYTKRHRFQMCVFPNPVLSTAIVEPFNCVLSSVRSNETCDLTCVMDNEALFSICHNSLSIPRPTYNNLNRVISQVFSDITCSLRFESALNADLDHMCTNLIPYPMIHYPIVCHTPLISNNKADHEASNTLMLTKTLFDRSNQMVSCNMQEGKYMCCVIQYRGHITPKEVNQSIFEIKRKNDIKFVEWCPTGFKLGVNVQPPTRVPSSEIAPSDKSVTMLANSTSVREMWEKIMYKFDILFSKRSFVHWYVGEGMEEGEFNEARDQLATMHHDYIELEACEDTEGENEGGPPAGATGTSEPPPPPAEAPPPAESGEDNEEAEEKEKSVPINSPEELDVQSKAASSTKTEEEDEDDEDDDDETEESETDN